MKFRNVPKGLVTIVILTVILTFIVIIPQLHETLIRKILGLLIVVFFPGYAISYFVFPINISVIERSIVGFGLSMVITFITAIALNFTPLGISLYSLTTVLATFTIVLSLFFIWKDKLYFRSRAKKRN